MKLNDPAAVARQYGDEGNLEARRSIYEQQEEIDPCELAFEAVAEALPVRLLEVGGGPGELAARIGEELGTEVVMVDVSARMVELARVLRPGGRLGAVTNAYEHLREIREIAGEAMWPRVFGSEDAAPLLERRFDSVDRRDAPGWVTIDGERTLCDYVASLQHEGRIELAPHDLPPRVRRLSTVFVAEKA